MSFFGNYLDGRFEDGESLTIDSAENAPDLDIRTVKLDGLLSNLFGAPEEVMLAGSDSLGPDLVWVDGNPAELECLKFSRIIPLGWVGYRLEPIEDFALVVNSKGDTASLDC